MQSRTTAAEGHPVCTSEALGARKNGEEAAKVARPDRMPAFAGFQLAFLGGIRLQEPVQLGLFTPAAAEVIKLGFACGRVEDDRVSPAGQLNDDSGRFATVEHGGAISGSLQPQPAAGGFYCHRVFDLGFDLNNVRQEVSPPFLDKWTWISQCLAPSTPAQHLLVPKGRGVPAANSASGK